ncbi:MAG: mechanosensitive ion channel family protein [Arenimonas sp.]
MSSLILPDLSQWGPTADWLLASAIAVVALLLLVLLRRLVRRRYKKLQATEKIELTELPLGVLSRTSVIFLVVVSAYLGLRFVELPERATHIVNSVITIVVFWQMGIWLSAAFVGWLDRKREHSLEHDRAKIGSISIIGLVVRVLIWVLVVLLALDNLGVNITALVAGLGIGGVAVALALQNILGDLFASLAIALDQPFVVGDFLTVGEVVGTVENIGIKSTRLRSISGEQVIVSNSDLLGSRVRNFGRMQERRADFVLNLAYETSAEQLEAVPGLVRAIVEAQKGTRFGRCHFANFGAYSLDFECVYFVLSPDYAEHMDVRQAINLAIFRKFQNSGIEFAYPTQTLLLSRATQDSPERKKDKQKEMEAY